MLCCVQQGLCFAAGFYRAEHQVASSKLENFNSVTTPGITKIRQRVFFGGNSVLFRPLNLRLTLWNYPDSMA